MTPIGMYERHAFEEYPRIQIISARNNTFIVVDENGDLLTFADDDALVEWIQGLYGLPDAMKEQIP